MTMEPFMHARDRRLLALCSVPAALLIAAGCEIDETCDPELDPNCELTDAGGTDTGGGGTDTGGGGTDTGGGTTTPDYRYVIIFDDSDQTGQHPGADIDGVELVSATSSFATRVTDFTAPTDANGAPDPQQAIGAPNGGTGGAHMCDLDSDPEHWYSLEGGWLVVDLGATVQDGDELFVYECSGSSGGIDDPYTVVLSTTPRVDDVDNDRVTVLEAASGTSSVIIDFDALGI